MRLNTITAAAILAFTSVAIAVGSEAAGSASTAVSNPVAQVGAEGNILGDNTDRAGPEDDLDENEVDGVGKRWNRGGSKSQRKYITDVIQKVPFLEWKRGEESPEIDEHSFNDVDGEEEGNGVEKRFNRGAHQQFYGTGSWNSPTRAWKRGEGPDKQNEYPNDDEEDRHDGQEKREMKHYVKGTDPKLDAWIENWLTKHGYHNKSGAENSNMGPGAHPNPDNKDQHGKTKRNVIQDEIEKEIEIINQTEKENEHENSPSAFRRRDNKGSTYVWEGHPGVIKDGKTNKVIWDSKKDAPKGKVKTKA